LVYHNDFTLLMQDVVLASVVGKAVINGVRDAIICSSAAPVFQVWVLEGDRPLPLLRRYRHRKHPENHYRWGPWSPLSRRAVFQHPLVGWSITTAVAIFIVQRFRGTNWSM
jgi:hypothetical protein